MLPAAPARAYDAVLADTSAAGCTAAYAAADAYLAWASHALPADAAQPSEPDAVQLADVLAAAPDAAQADAAASDAARPAAAVDSTAAPAGNSAEYSDLAANSAAAGSDCSDSIFTLHGRKIRMRLRGCWRGAFVRGLIRHRPASQTGATFPTGEGTGAHASLLYYSRQYPLHGAHITNSSFVTNKQAATKRGRWGRGPDCVRARRALASDIRSASRCSHSPHRSRRKRGSHKDTQDAQSLLKGAWGELFLRKVPPTKKFHLRIKARRGGTC